MTTQNKHQLIYDANNNPVFAVIPYSEYVKMSHLVADKLEQPSPLFSKDSLFIDLPHGGQNASIDLIVLASYCQNCNITAIPIGARQQRLSKFNHNQLGALDPLLRMCFLSPSSPYRNTMQATTEVIEALVQTGLFTRTRKDFNNPEKSQQFYRPVNALNVNKKEVEEFLKINAQPKFEIPCNYWNNEQFNQRLFD